MSSPRSDDAQLVAIGLAFLRRIHAELRIAAARAHIQKITSVCGSCCPSVAWQMPPLKLFIYLG